MFDVLEGVSAPVIPRAPAAPAALAEEPCYLGPERRRGGAAVGRWLTACLDEVDYPMLLVAEGARVLHANRTALLELEEGHPLRIVAASLQTRSEADAAPLRAGIEGAIRRSLRRLLTLRGDGHVASVAIVPLALARAEGQRAALLMFGKRRVCQTLSMQWFARSHGLTPSETQVLEALCDCACPQEIADRHGVMLSTVRTQIGSVRAKTGARNLRELVQQVSVLPPLLALQCVGMQAVR